MKKSLVLISLLAVCANAQSMTINVEESIPVYEGSQKERVCDNGGSGSNVLGTIGGAVGGGMLGNQIGKGRGRTVAVIAGSILGGYVGSKVEQKIKNGGDNCRYVETPGHLVGYNNIGYYNGRKYTKFSKNQLSTITVNVQ